MAEHVSCRIPLGNGCRRNNKKIKEITPVIFVDFHAEASALKKFVLENTMNLELVLLLVRTFTHVQTADEKILNENTAYITDAGFCGGNGVIGMDYETSLKAGYITS